MKRSFKKFRNFSKFLYNINFGQTHYSHYSRNSKTFDRKSNSSFRKENSSSNLIQPEIEYVTKLNFFIPKSPNIENKKTSNYRRFLSIFNTGLILFNLAHDSPHYYNLKVNFILYDI